jgi:hypothetical protein
MFSAETFIGITVSVPFTTCVLSSIKLSRSPEGFAARRLPLNTRLNQPANGVVQVVSDFFEQRARDEIVVRDVHDGADLDGVFISDFTFECFDPDLNVVQKFRSHTRESTGAVSSRTFEGVVINSRFIQKP